ncbi:MAG: hypothetical protein MUP17_07375 [candidate division Zixibacteria bacterium]|nr:hypothetical protein [candidate division Zixibacteria bacterium]
MSKKYGFFPIEISGNNIIHRPTLPYTCVNQTIPVIERSSAFGTTKPVRLAKTEKGVNCAIRLTGCNTFYNFQLTDKRLKNYLIQDLRRFIPSKTQTKKGRILKKE